MRRGGPPAADRATIRAPSAQTGLVLAAEDESVPIARGVLESFLEAHGIGPDDRFDARLVVSELVGNAISHGNRRADSVTLDLELVGSILRIAVGDAARGGTPLALTPEPTSEKGWGLHLVQQLTSTWSHRISQGRRVVTAEVPVPRRP